MQARYPEHEQFLLCKYNETQGTITLKKKKKKKKKTEKALHQHLFEIHIASY